MNALELHGLEKHYPDFALGPIDLELPGGTVCGLIGENGAGKSTLMNVLFGMPVIHETGGFGGEIYLNGEKTTIASPHDAMTKGIGMVHQHFMLVEAMTVFENIILGDRNTKGIFIDKEARKKEILELAERYGDKAPDLNIDEALVDQFLQAQDQAGRDAALDAIRKNIADQIIAGRTKG